jgi:hypothetical protein
MEQSDPAASVEPEIGEIPQNPGPEEIVLPQDDYVLADDDLAVVNAAVQPLVQACLAEAGYEFSSLEAADGVDPPSNFRRYGLVDAEAAATDGYAVPQTASSQIKTAYDTFGQRYGDAGLMAMEGCFGSAHDRVGWGRHVEREVTEAVESIFANTWEQSFEDSRVQAAFDEWSACMAEDGYDYADPLRVDPNDVNPLPTQTAEQEASGVEQQHEANDAEIALATAEVRCAEAHNVAGIWLAVETAYQLEQVDENAEVLTGCRQRVNEVLAAAAELSTGT